MAIVTTKEKISNAASKIELKIKKSQYDTCMLGIKFYKYLCDNELQFIKKEGMTDNEIKALSENDVESVEYIQSNIGYFIAHENLFSSWIEIGHEFDVSNVMDAMHAFNRLVETGNKEHDKIIIAVQSTLTKLGDTCGEQSNALSNMIYSIENPSLNKGSDFNLS